MSASSTTIHPSSRGALLGSRNAVALRAPRRPSHVSSRVHSTGDIQDPSGIMNDQFMSVLKESLARQGDEALLDGPAADEFRKSATIEMLEGALTQSVASLKAMNQWKAQIDAQVVAQEKQVQRLHFALKKAQNDDAYMRSLKQMLNDGLSD
jgi:hypothetical protein